MTPGPWTAQHLAFDIGGLMHEMFPNAWSGGFIQWAGGIQGVQAEGGLYVDPAAPPPPDATGCRDWALDHGGFLDPARGWVLPLTGVEL